MKEEEEEEHTCSLCQVTFERKDCFLIAVRRVLSDVPREFMNRGQTHEVVFCSSDKNLEQVHSDPRRLPVNDRNAEKHPHVDVRSPN